MKKIIALISALCLCLSATACSFTLTGEIGTSTTTTTAATTTTKATTTEKTVVTTTVTSTTTAKDVPDPTATEDVLAPARQKIEKGVSEAADVGEFYLTALMDSIKNQDKASFCVLVGGTSAEAYAFLKSTVLTGYKILGKTTDNVDLLTSYSVEMEFSESGSDFFPVGKSEWKINVCGEFTPVASMSRDSATHKSQEITQMEASQFSVMLMAYLCGTRDVSDFSAYIGSLSADEKANVEHWMFHTLIASQALTVEDPSAEKVRETVKTVFGYDGYNVESIPSYDKTSDSVKSCGHGGNWSYNTILSENVSGDNITVKVRYYADANYIATAVDMVYTYERADGVLKFISQKAENDSGFPVKVESM